MDRIKEAVREFKAENGNKDIPTKDLLIYLVQRMDKLPCIEHIRTIEHNKTINYILTILITGILLKIIVFP